MAFEGRFATVPLFECSQCGVIENTAVTPESWGNLCDKKPMRCSQCATGKWHDLFPRRQFEGSGYVRNGDWRLEHPPHKSRDK